MSATVCPVAVKVLSPSGTVSGDQNLVGNAPSGGAGCGSGTATLTLTVGGPTPTIVLDYGKDVGGVPFFDVAAETGSPTLQAGYSESLEYLSATGDRGFGGSQRVSTFAVTAPGHIVNTSVQGGERYEEITLPPPSTQSGTVTLTLSDAGISYIADRTSASGYQGFFVSSSDELNRIWYAGAYTAQLDSVPVGSLPGANTNTLPSILDGAKRDRKVWSGDLDVEGHTVYDSTGNANYLKGSLQLLGSYQLSSGFVTGDKVPTAPLNTGPLPGTTGTYSASYSMYWVVGLGAYCLYTGDTAFVQQEWPIVKNELAWNATQLDTNGLFTTDTTDGRDWDYGDGEKTGEVTLHNLLYYKALRDAAQMATALSDAGDTPAAGDPSYAAQAGTYTSKAAALKTAINAHLFNSTAGLYDISDSKKVVVNANGTYSNVAQDANSLAVLYGVAPATDATSILAKLKTALWTTPYGPVAFTPDTGYGTVISPFVGGYELDARLANNDTTDAEALLHNEWGNMITPGVDYTGTMWEHVATDGRPGTSTGSLAHGWSTMPTSALSGYVLGIQPVTAGYATWRVQPHPGDLAWAQGQAPTPHGPVAVSWAHDTGGSGSVNAFTLRVTVPAGTSGTIAVPTEGATDVTVGDGGSVVWNGSTFLAANAPAGITGAQADPNDPGYVDLTVAASTTAVTYDVTAADPPTTYCAAEHGTCSFTGTHTVAYGAGSAFIQKQFTGGAACTNTAFGQDPDPGVVKACFLLN